MPEPTFDQTTQDFYEALPEHYRTIDIPTDYSFKKYLSGPGKMLDRLRELKEGIAYEPDANPPDNVSTLVDAAVAPKEWLPWIAQVLGVSNIQRLPVAQQRDLLVSLPQNPKGSNQSWVEAVQKYLAGEKYVRVLNFTETSANPGEATMWDVLVITKTSETLTNAVPRQWSEARSVAAWYSSEDEDHTPTTTENDEFFNGSALVFATDAAGHCTFYPTINNTSRIVAPSNANFSVFFKAALALVGSTEITLHVECFNAGGASLGELTEDFVITDTPQSLGKTFTTLVNTATVKISFTQSASGVVTRRNYALQPLNTSANSDGSYWKFVDSYWGAESTTTFFPNGGPVNDCAYARKTIDAFSHTTAGRWVLSCNPTSGGSAGAPLPVAAGQQFTISFYVRYSVAQTTEQMTIRFVDNSGVAVGADVTTPLQAITPNVWSRISATVTVPVGATKVRVNTLTNVAAGNGETYDATALLVEAGSSVGTYFDGSTPDTVGVEYAWDGATNDSTSTRGTLLDSDIIFGEFGARGNSTDLTWILETLSVADIIEQANLKPAGVVVHHETFTKDWDAIEVANPSFTIWDSKDWDTIEEGN